MHSLPTLPRASSTNDGSEPVCPWCKEQMFDATVRVGDLNAAWQDHETDHPARSDDGQAGCDLVAACPSCQRPSMVALGRYDVVEFGERFERRYIRLVPVRTAADVEYLELAR